MKNDWDYNISKERPDGRIVLPARHVHPEDARMVSGRDADLTDHPDKTIRLTRLGVALLLGQCDGGRVDGLVRARLLDEPEDGWFRIEPNATLHRLFDHAAATMPIPVSKADFDAAKLALKVTKAPLEVMPPHQVFVGIAQQLGPERYRQLDRVYKFITHQRWPIERLYAKLDEVASELGWTPGQRARSEERDWDWSIRSRDPRNRILIRASQVHPNDRGEILPCGSVDLTGRDRPVRLLEVAVKELLATQEGAQIFVDAGVLFRDGEHYMVTPHWTKRTIYELWEASLDEPATMAEFAFAKKMRKACSVPVSRLPPQAVINGAARALVKRGAFVKGELNAYMHVGSNAKEVIAAVRHAAAIIHVRDQMSFPGAEIDEDACAAMFPFLAGMANSYFDAELGEAEDRESEYDGPNAVARKRLAKLGPMRDIAAAFAYGRAASIRHPAVLATYLRAVARFEREARSDNPGFDPTCQASLDRALEHVAFSPSPRVRLADAVRDAMVRQTLIVLRDARRRIRGLDPKGKRGILRRAPAIPSDLPDFKRRLFGKYGSLRPAQQASRKSYSDKVVDRYERVVDGAAFRVGQIREDGEAARAAIDILLEPANASLAYWDFEVSGLNLSEAGLPVGGMQTRYYRCWRVDQADLSVLLDRPPGSEPAPEIWPGDLSRVEKDRVERAARRYTRRARETGSGRGKAVLLHGAEFIFEHLGTTGAVGAVEPVQAWYLTLAQNNALAPAGHLDVGQKERREALIKRWHLPPHRDFNGGLFGFDERRGVTARLASQSSRDHRRTFVPIEELEYCLRLAGHGLDCVVQTWCRRGEFLQQTQWEEDWDPPEFVENGGWYAYGKARRGEPLPDPRPFIECADAVHDEAMELAEINARRSGWEDGNLPDVAPLPQLAWKCGPQPYIFSLAGKFIENRQLGHFLRLLLANIGNFRFHDFRHAGSNQARMEHLPLVGIAAGLTQRSLIMADYYSGLTKKQLEDATRQAVEDKMHRIARDEEKRAAAEAIQGS